MIKLLIGGSPCTYWSIAQKNGRETTAEGQGWELFKNYLIAKEKFQPDFFLYENNKSASSAIKNQIKEELGVWDGTMYTKDTGARYIEINSALVSAQNRQRFYVHNCGEVEQPEDRGILLKDILESGIDLTGNSKTYCLTSTYNGAVAWNTLERGQRSMVAEPVRIPPYGVNDKARPVQATYSNHAGTGIGSLKDRLFSENPNKQQVDLVAEPVNVTADGKSQTIKAQYQNISTVNICCYTSTYGATGVAEPVNVTADGKAQCLRASCYKDGIRNMVANSIGKRTCAAEPVYVGEVPDHNGQYRNGEQASQQYRVYSADGKSVCLDKDDRKYVAEPIKVGALPRPNGELSTSQAMRVYGVEGKSVTQSAGGGGMGGKTGLYAVPCGYSGKPPLAYEVKDGKITIKDKQYPIKLADGYYIIRKLTVTECERLQTLPDGYCRAVSNAQAYKGLGNGWTAEVIIHILNGALKDVPRDEEIVVLSMYDGIGTGRYCLDKMGFTNVKYYAYEIDKYAMQIAKSNYPDIIYRGDAFDVRKDDFRI